MDHIRTGCLPYEDGSGFKIEIEIDSPCEVFEYPRVQLNPDSKFTDFDIDDWEEINSAIDRAIHAYRSLASPTSGSAV